MTFSIEYTERAIEDILRNASWWAQHHSLQQALDWEARIYEQIKTLSEMPERHALAPESAKASFDVRQKLVGLGTRPSYRAVYTIRNSVIIILAVRRGQQDEIDVTDLS